MDENTIALFEDYISGNLSEEDATVLKQRLDNEEELAAAFITFTDITAHFDNKFSEDREQVKQTIASVDSSFTMSGVQSKTETKVRRLTFIKYAIAASVLLLFGTMFVLQWSQPSYEDYAFDETISLVERGGDDTAFAKAEKAFNNSEYKQAIEAFDSILINGPNAEISYYKGIALIELNRYAEGEAVFEKLANENSVFMYKAQFYRALSLLKQNKIAKAIDLLKVIPKEAEVYSKAQELYKKLK